MKDDTISRQAVINLIKRSINFKNIVFEGRRYDLLESEDEGAMLHDVEALPSAQPDRGSIEQIKWERDLAIQQLKDLGYGLGEKPRTNGDLIDRHLIAELVDAHGNVHWEDIAGLPPAQPHDIARDIATIIENEKDMRVMLKNVQPDCTDCISHGGDWECDHQHCHKGHYRDDDIERDKV